MRRSDAEAEAGIALPTVLLVMLVLLALGGLFASNTIAAQRTAGTSQNFEVGLHVAETGLELAIAAMADPAQEQQPVEVMTPATAHPDGPRAWAVEQALAEVTADCGRFERTAGGDALSLLDSHEGVLYGVAFLPDCQQRTTIRVVRVAYDTRPARPYPAPVAILTGGDINIGNNTWVASLHANGNVSGNFRGTPTGPYSAGGTSCTIPTCETGAGDMEIPNLHARAFWESRNEPLVKGNGNHPFYELCPDGTVRVDPVAPAPAPERPCTGPIVPVPHVNWTFHSAWTYPNNYNDPRFPNRNWGPTWRWSMNSNPPAGIYYAYQTNVVTEGNAGQGNVSPFTVVVEADRDQLRAGNGAHSGNIAIMGNPKLNPAWPGVALAADVDMVIDNNIEANGRTTMVFAREQFAFMQNPRAADLFFVACDNTLISPGFDGEARGCQNDRDMRNTQGSPLNATFFRRNPDVDYPGEDEMILPNLGITGVVGWEAL